MLKFSLIVPNTRYEADYLWSILPSRGLLSLAGCLRKNNYPVNYIDADFENLSHKEVIRRLDSFSVDIVGITMNTFQAKAGIDLAKAIKQHSHNIKIIVGGPHPSALRKNILLCYSWVDVACIREGEETIVELAKAIENGRGLTNITGISYRIGNNVYDNMDRPFIEDLDSIPYPAYDLAGNIDRYPGAQPVLKPPSMHIMASRGCPFHCIFCTKCVWGNSVRFRSPDRIIDEVEFLHHSYGINEIFFQDDTMNLNRKWFFAVCDEIIKRNLNKEMALKTPFRVDRKLVDLELLQKAKDAGFHTIFYGVESGSQKVLDTIKKGTTIEEIKRAFDLTHKVGIKTIAAFMVGNIGDTKQTIVDSIKLAKRIKPDVFGFSIATPLPGTEFYNIAKKKEWIVSEDFSEWSQFTAVARNADLTAEEITKLRDFADNDVRNFLNTQKGDFEMQTIIQKIKIYIKATPVLGPIALSIWYKIKPKLKKTPDSWISNNATQCYANLNTDEIKQHMNKRYEQNQAYNYNVRWDIVRANEINNITMEMISPIEEKEILELGCALGGVAALVSNCKKYIGTDLSEKAVEIANKNLKTDNISFMPMDALNIKFDDDSFDVVLAREVIEHLPDIDKCLNEVYRVLRLGGILVLTSPNRDSLHLRVCRMLGIKEFACSFDHINEISYHECKGKLEGVGFKITTAEGVFLKPYWGVPGLDEHVRALTDNDHEMVEIQRKLGRLCGPEFGFCYAIKAAKPM